MLAGAVDATVIRAPVPVGPGWTEELTVGKGAADVTRVEVVTAKAEVVTAEAMVVALAEVASADMLAWVMVEAEATDLVVRLVKPAGRVMPLAVAHWVGVLVCGERISYALEEEGKLS